MDRRSAVRAKVTTEPAGRAARHKQETGWWRGSDTRSCRWQERWQGMTHTSMPLLSPRGRRGHGHSARPPTTQHPVGSILPRSQLSSVTSPRPPRVGAALPETLMGTTLVCTEQDWCHCFSSTVGRGKALGQAVCLSGVVGRLREVSGGLTPSVLALLLSSSSARRLGGCGEKHESPLSDRKGHPHLAVQCRANVSSPADVLPPHRALRHKGASPLQPWTHHKHKLEALGGRGPGRGLRGGAGGWVAGGTEGLPSHSALSILLLILLCKGNRQ